MAEEAEVRRKIRKAAQMLLLQRPRAPGVKGWELRRAIGRDYAKIVEVLNSELEKLDLQVKVVYERGDISEEPAPEDFDQARFFILLKSSPSPAELPATGWRIDDVAALAAAVAYVISRQGKAPRKDVEQLLREKFVGWKVEFNLERFIRKGYLLQDKDDTLSVGWRTRAEIDQRNLLNLLLSTPGGADTSV